MAGLTGKRARRHGAALLVLLAACLTFVLPAGAAPATRVFDDAGLFQDTEIAALETAIVAKQAQTGFDLVVATADDTGGKSPQAYADDYFDNHGFGTGTQNSGAILLIDMEHRQVVISAFGTAADCMPDARIEAALDVVTPHLADADYTGAVHAFLDQAAQYAAAGPTFDGGDEAAGGTPEQTPPRSTGLTWSQVPLLLLSGGTMGLVSLLVVLIRYRNRGAKAYRYPYREKAQVRPTQTEDIFLHKQVTTRVIQRDNDHHSSGGGGSSSHSSGGGRSHSSGSRGF